MKKYLSASGLDLSTSFLLNEITSDVLNLPRQDFAPAQFKELYRYDVPEIIEGPGCGLKAKEPYLLDQTLEVFEANWAENPSTLRIFRLNQIVQKLQEITKVDWLGIYRKTKNLAGEEVLLKEAYYGRFSRAEFPLNAEFAKGSNNSTVGLSGKAIVVQDVEAYAGPYYTCDTEVQSEFCLPIFDENDEVIGIIDAEAFAPGFFTDKKLAEIAKVACDLGKNKEALLSE